MPTSGRMPPPARTPTTAATARYRRQKLTGQRLDPARAEHDRKTATVISVRAGHYFAAETPQTRHNREGISSARPQDVPLKRLNEQLLPRCLPRTAAGRRKSR
jgi:hypothetical protein